MCLRMSSAESMQPSVNKDEALRRLETAYQEHAVWMPGSRGRHPSRG